METLFRALIENVAISLVCVFLFGFSLARLQRLPALWRRIIIGTIFGVFGVLNVIWAVTIQAGIIVDIRGPFIVVAGVYGGWLGGGIAAGLIAAYRLLIVGGVGAWPAVLSIVLNVGLGAWWYPRRHDIPVWVWPLLGLASVGLSTGSGLMLGPELASLFLASFLPTALILYPITTTLIGLLIRREYERLDLLERLREGEARFRAIFNGSFQMTGLLTTDGTLLEANTTALAFGGVRAEEVVGKPFWETVWWAYAPDVQERLKQAIRQAAAGDFVRYRENVLGAEGRHMLIDFSLKPVTGHNSTVTQLIPEGRDITAVVKAEEQRMALEFERDRNRLYRDFIADSSHHLRSPLTIIKTSTFVIERLIDLAQHKMTLAAPHLRQQAAPYIVDAQSDLEKAAGHMPNLHAAFTDLRNTIEDLLELSRVERIGDVHITQVDINRLLTREVGKFSDVAQEAGIALSYVPTAEALSIPIDQKDLQHMVENLLNNALKYTLPGGEVTVSASTEGQHALITVTDTGIGIGPEDLPHVFGRFYRTADAKRHNARGSGLGLAIVQQKATLHGGSITVVSSRTDGSSFTLRLPLSRPAPVEEPRTP